MDPVSRLLATLIGDEDLKPLVEAMKAHDAGTYRHSLRVARFAIHLGRADGLEDTALEELAVAALLHDLGKTRIDAALVNKPGPLDPDELDEIREHARAANADIAALTRWPEAHRIAPLHHEVDQPNRYPRSGDERRGSDRAREGDRRRPIDARTLRLGRLVALADRYDSLIAHRPYKGPIPPAEVRARLAAEMPDLAPLLDQIPDFGRPPR